MSKVWRTLTGSVLTVALVLWALSAGAQQGKEWPIYGADYANTRYSALDQINTKNVRRLRVAWIRSLGTIESQEATPIVVGDTMYVSTSTGPRYVFALSARDGTVKWKYEPELPKDVVATVCCGLDSRGVAYANGRVFVTRLDAKLVALDANTGKELWTVTVVDYKAGHAITSPPLVYKNLVVTGFAGGEYGVRGAVQAYRQDSGELAWKTYTIPGPGEPGNESWMGDSWKTGAGSTWYVGSYDPKLNLVYWGTSNAGPWGAHTRSTDTSEYGQYTNLHTASQLAFDADSGRIAWASDDPGRRVGLRRRQRGGARGSHGGRPDGTGADEGRSERLLLRAQSRDRQAGLGRAFRGGQLGQEHRQEHRPSDRGPGEAATAQQMGAERVSEPLRGQELGADVLQPPDRAGVHPVLQPVHGHRGQGGGLLTGQVLPGLRVRPGQGRHGRAPLGAEGLGPGEADGRLGHQGGPALPRRRDVHRGRPGLLRQHPRCPQGGRRKDRGRLVEVQRRHRDPAKPDHLRRRRQAVPGRRGGPREGAAVVPGQDRSEGHRREP